MEGMVNRMEKLTEVSNGSTALSAQLDELMVYKQEQLKRLQHDVTLEQSVLAQTKEAIRQAQVQAKYDQQVERQKFLDGLEEEKAALHRERKSLEALDLDVEGRRKEIEILEAKAEPLRQALTKFAEERLAVEHQRLRNEELRQENDQLSSTATALHEEVAMAQRTLATQQARLDAQAREQETLQQRLEVQQKSVSAQVENLTALQKTLDPKLAEVKRLSEQSEANQHQAEVLLAAVQAKESEVAKQRTDLATLSTQLQAKAEALTEYDAALRRTEAELRVKLQQAKVTGVTVEMPPTLPAELKKA